jgi:ElaB protein
MEAGKKLEQEFQTLQEESKNIKKRARENYLEQVSDISEKIKQIGDNAGEKAKQVLDNMSEYIEKNPQKATLVGLGVGLGVGVVLGMLLRSRKD